MAKNPRMELYFNLAYEEQKELYEKLKALKSGMGITNTQAVLVVLSKEPHKESYETLSKECEELKLLLAQKEYQLIKLRAQMADQYFEGQETGTKQRKESPQKERLEPAKKHPASVAESVAAKERTDSIHEKPKKAEREFSDQASLAPSALDLYSVEEVFF